MMDSAGIYLSTLWPDLFHLTAVGGGMACGRVGQSIHSPL